MNYLADKDFHINGDRPQKCRLRNPHPGIVKIWVGFKQLYLSYSHFIEVIFAFVHHEIIEFRTFLFLLFELFWTFFQRMMLREECKYSLCKLNLISFMMSSREYPFYRENASGMSDEAFVESKERYV